MVGADLANLVNEAALLAARLGPQPRSSPADFAQSLEKIILGAERKIMLTPADRRRTAYHEAGHALVGMLTPGSDPVRKITIVPRGQALGVTLSSPDVDRFNYSRAELEARVKMTLGGRAAEEVVFGDQTTGAEGDIAQVTALVRHMVGRWGMSRDDRDGRGPAARRQQTRGASWRRRGRSSSSTRRCGGRSRRRTTRSWRCSPPSARGSTRSPRRCSSVRRSTRSTPTASPASPSPSRCRSTDQPAVARPFGLEDALLVAVAHAGPLEACARGSSARRLRSTSLVSSRSFAPRRMTPRPRHDAHARVDRQLAGDELRLRFRGGLDGDANGHDPLSLVACVAQAAARPDLAGIGGPPPRLSRRLGC